MLFRSTVTSFVNVSALESAAARPLTLVGSSSASVLLYSKSALKAARSCRCVVRAGIPRVAISSRILRSTRVGIAGLVRVRTTRSGMLRRRSSSSWRTNPTGPARLCGIDHAGLHRDERQIGAHDCPRDNPGRRSLKVDDDSVAAGCFAIEGRHEGLICQAADHLDLSRPTIVPSGQRMISIGIYESDPGALPR